MATLDRRTFLIASGALALAACSSDAKSGGSAIKTSKDGYGLVPRFDRGIVVPGDVRMPFSLASGTTSEVLSDGPETLRGTILDANDKVVVESLTAKRRRVTDGIVYWDVRANIAQAGQYTLYIDGGSDDGAAVSVSDPATVEVPYPGQQLPPFDTATTADPGGVDPLCTRLEGGPCPFHSITLTEALTMGKPVAYLIGTPAHCKFGTCAPGLEFLINSAQRLGDKLVAVHTEVFVDDTATTTAPAVDAYHISGEPDLWITDASGVIIERFEGAWDQTELDEVLDRIVA